MALKNNFDNLDFDNQYDVGVDNNNFTPVNLEDLLDKLHYQIHIK